MSRQERKHAARRQQMPRPRLHITKLALILRPTLHHKIIPLPGVRPGERHPIVQQSPSANPALYAIPIFELESWK